MVHINDGESKYTLINRIYVLKGGTLTIAYVFTCKCLINIKSITMFLFIYINSTKKGKLCDSSFVEKYDM